MKTYKISKEELHERLDLDKRRDHRAFCICFKTLEEAPDGFYDLQNEIVDGLEKVFWLNFDNGAEHLRLRPCDSEFFCFITDMFGSERMVVEINDKILGDKLLGLIMAYLEKCPSRYCVVAKVYNEVITGSKFIGRFVINQDEIAVEESLCETWSRQVKIMEIEG